MCAAGFGTYRRPLGNWPQVGARGAQSRDVRLHQVGGKRAEQHPQEQRAASCTVASASPGAPRRHRGTRRASSGFIPPPRLPLPPVPPGAVLRALGRFRNRGGCRGYSGPALTLGLVLEPGRGLWSGALVRARAESRMAGPRRMSFKANSRAVSPRSSSVA
jgi:hypothetical protein